jgi:hypothetical protein
VGALVCVDERPQAVRISRAQSMRGRVRGIVRPFVCAEARK